jgi:hypothetical protein
MISWMEERDRLVAQTQAFVQQVAAAHPKEPARPVIEQLMVVETAPELPAAIEAPAPTPPALAEPMAPMAISAPVQPLPPIASERSDILQRVAAFRARQARMNEERETYYQTMQAKIRHDLGNEAGTGRL